MQHITIEPKLIAKVEDVTPTVLAAMAKTTNPRLKAVMDRLIHHLHQFTIETRPTEEEFEYGLRWIAALGHHTHETNNEVVLAADVLGASTLIDLINNDGMQGETMSALLGPFYRGHAPDCANGDCIARSETPGPALFFKGRVIGLDGAPVAGAKLDIWQASPVGLYENQDADQDDFNLRGVFHTDEAGSFHFTSVKPAGYPVPTDGPVGVLLHAQHRHPMRPAHIHFIVSAPGHKTLITQIFSDTPQALATDVVFGAKVQIVGDFVEHTEPHAEYPGAQLPFYSCEYTFRLLEGEPTYPVPPISGTKA
ncbi:MULTISPECIES: dioxygenase [Rhizobium]|uniref:Catechol 1,2-dioxygenase n=1 Tax=Rhizobium favelukesii TaxID=348824 RepID=W6RJF4_9HYPH|nr:MULTISPECIES: dioxygenase [Rhizobium]MCA0806882.1 catechol 1,2-dioxygenase [Rhizobium sp. T1473]MCS0460694.1 catechol 1,2-dioxygenase [Rhizobium favelukesii]UFS85646.1 catechol 1,2-dioxygenase [Rhizobium sp. T136]CDM60979.1 catechol 1,2-dioxygenase [Rhizobium favelukesii]